MQTTYAQSGVRRVGASLLLALALLCLPGTSVVGGSVVAVSGDVVSGAAVVGGSVVPGAQGSAAGRVSMKLSADCCRTATSYRVGVALVVASANEATPYVVPSSEMSSRTIPASSSRSR